nr:MAG TPA_asm: hypothetical protein [Caudoviricetes sp.]
MCQAQQKSRAPSIIGGACGSLRKIPEYSRPDRMAFQLWHNVKR